MIEEIGKASKKSLVKIERENTFWMKLQRLDEKQ